MKLLVEGVLDNENTRRIGPKHSIDFCERLTLVRVRSELEYERTWRLDELRFLENFVAAIQPEDDQRRFRKALVVMLYSHYEGFCKMALLIYLRAINKADLRCAEVNDALAAAALGPLFNMVTSGGKHPVFRNRLPDDTKLHAFSRRVDFLSGMPQVLAEPVAIDDELVNTASNLTSLVLRKNLFQLGLDEELAEAHRGTVDRLVHTRNAIAHGDLKDGPDATNYESLRASTLGVIDAVATAVVDAIEKGTYRCEKPRLEVA